MSLLLVGCGVPISPEAITATAVAEREAAALDTPGGGASSLESELAARTEPLGFSGTTTQASEPLAALPTPSATATEEATQGTEGTAAEEETPTPEATTEGASEPEPDETPTEVPTPTATPEPTATPAPAVAAGVNEGYPQEFLTLLNAQRTGRGIAALSFNTILAAEATEYAGYMGTANFFDHTGPDGSTPGSRVIASGYAGAWNGESLSAGQHTAQLALQVMLASPSHAAILLDTRSVEVGIGYAFVPGSRYLHYWVIITGIP